MHAFAPLVLFFSRHFGVTFACGEVNWCRSFFSSMGTVQEQGMIFSLDRALTVTGVAVTDVGHKRERNEDAVISLSQKGVFCVADGMGGAHGGKEASQTIISTISDRVERDFSPEAIAREVLGAIHEANRRIFVRAVERRVAGMGSTVVAVVIPPGRRHACVLHAGDSRAYLMRRKKLQRLTVDHSMATEMGLGDNEVVPKFIEGMVTRAVGLGESLDVDSRELKIKSGDVLLLCSDGLNKHLSDAEIADHLAAFPQDTVQAIANRLIIETKKRGAVDNVSVIVVGIQRGRLNGG